MIEDAYDWLSTGVWWIDALVIWGIAFILLLFPGIPLWTLVSKIRHRRKDAIELAASEAQIALARKLSSSAGAQS